LSRGAVASESRLNPALKGAALQESAFFNC